MEGLHTQGSKGREWTRTRLYHHSQGGGSGDFWEPRPESWLAVPTRVIVREPGKAVLGPDPPPHTHTCGTLFVDLNLGHYQTTQKSWLEVWIPVRFKQPQAIVAAAQTSALWAVAPGLSL